MNHQTSQPQHIIHPIPPTWNRDSRILILGSFPSVRSREMAYFYGHPQNRFWQVLAEIFRKPFPESVEERRAFLLENRVAAWDVIASCTISGSSDSSIRDVTINDLHPILEGADIQQIYVNGKKAYQLYERYTRPAIGRDAVCLPSTSPANAAWTLEKLIEVWSQIRQYE